MQFSCQNGELVEQDDDDSSVPYPENQSDEAYNLATNLLTDRAIINQILKFQFYLNPAKLVQVYSAKVY